MLLSLVWNSIALHLAGKAVASKTNGDRLTTHDHGGLSGVGLVCEVDSVAWLKTRVHVHQVPLREGVAPVLIDQELRLCARLADVIGMASIDGHERVAIFPEQISIEDLGNIEPFRSHTSDEAVAC